MQASVLATTLAIVAVAAPPLEAQSKSAFPNITGVWGPYRAGRGGDARLAAPAAGPIVLKPEFAQAYEARKTAEAEATRRGEPIASPATLCVPYGMPQMMSVAVYPIEILQTPGQITIITEAFSEVRRVFLDKPQQKVDDVAPGYYGSSVGRWEGNTLVVETVGIKESVQGYRGIPHSKDMRITERIHLVTPDILHDQITIDDPVVLEKPVVYTLAYERMPGYQMVEFVCDNNREYLDEKGQVRLRLRDK